jgi:MoaA/NifB/PqqE/SkfB family radical SAM enzyme
MPGVPYPIDAVLAVTYKCQSRCRMCSIWQINEYDDAPPHIYRKLPATLMDVNLSGGEPFLRKDLAEIVRIVHGRVPKARIIVSTNGLMGEVLVPRALELVKIDPGIGFGISVDGVGEMQDFIRGVKGAFDNAVAAAKGLKAEGVDNIRFAFTLTRENAGHMTRVYELAGELGVQFTMAMAHDSDFFFGSHDSAIVRKGGSLFVDDALRRDLERIIRNELASYDLKSWGKAFIYHGMYSIMTEGKRPFGNRPGVDYFYLDPKGDIYPSVVHDSVMGNLAREDFDSIWNSERSNEIRKRCAADERPYWMGCMMRKSLLDHRFQIGLWVLRHKLFGIRLKP